MKKKLLLGNIIILIIFGTILLKNCQVKATGYKTWTSFYNNLDNAVVGDTCPQWWDEKDNFSNYHENWMCAHNEDRREWIIKSRSSLQSYNIE